MTLCMRVLGWPSRLVWWLLWGRGGLCRNGARASVIRRVCGCGTSGTGQDSGGESDDERSDERCEEEDEEGGLPPRDASSEPFFLPEHVFDALRAGDVILVSARWLLRRAGYMEDQKGRWREATQYDPLQPHPELALPNRQQIETNFADEAIVTASALEELYGRFRQVMSSAMNSFDGRSAQADGVDALPVVSISHCWYNPAHPDPDAHTLRDIARALAARLPKYAAWGFDDVAVFLDWCLPPWPRACACACACACVS